MKTDENPITTNRSASSDETKGGRTFSQRQPVHLGSTPHPAFGHPLPSSDEGRGQGEGCPLPNNSPSSIANWYQAIYDPLSAINRRRFLAFTSGCFLGAAPVLAGGSRPIDIGPLKDFASDGISEKFIQHNFFVIRNRGRLYATIATCPHKGNYLLVDPKNATRIICSGHDSVFNAEGMTTGGKAKRNLARFAIALNAQGRVLVNTDKDFQQTQWNDKASYVAVR